MLTIPFDVRQVIIALITGTGGPLDDADIEVGLLTAMPSQGTRVTLADCEALEPDGTSFPGYARKTTLTWSAIFRDGADNVYQDLGELDWVANADPPEQLTIVGAFWTTGTNVIVDQFSTPQVIESELDPIRYVPQFGYGQ